MTSLKSISLNVLLIACIGLFSSSHALAEKTITVAIDTSGSNPLLVHQYFADAAADYVAGQIRQLKDGDRVWLKTFGSRTNPDNLIERTVVITRQERAAKVANEISNYIQSLPSQGLSQGATNLLAFLEFGDGFNCTNDSAILVLTDAIEHSGFVDGSDLLEGRASLPAPDVDFTGCALTLYGLGAGLSGPQVKTLRREWTQWADQTGAAFKAVVR